MGSGIYEIDSSDVNSRVDWRHRYIPGKLTSRRSEGFPGDPNRYIVKGLVLPMTLIVTGLLEATSFTALHTALAVYELMQEDLSVHTVLIQAKSYTNMDLANFQTQGGPRPLERSGTLYQTQRVMFRWEQIQR